MLLQDVTITLDLSNMSVDKYKELMQMFKGISEENLDTFTYSSEQINGDYLTESDAKLFKTFK